MKPTLLLDMDGPLADFDRLFWARCHGRGYRFDIEQFDDQTHRFLSDHIPNRRQRSLSRDMVNTAGWFYDLPVTPGSVAGVAELLNHFEIWVVTKPLAGNPTCLDDKNAWLNEHFPALEGRLVTCHDKSIVCGDILLDDAIKLDWIPRASWTPVVFDGPFNGAGSAWAGLPHWNWDSPVEALSKHLRKVWA